MPLTLAVEIIEPGVRLITLQRPQALNALTTELLGELADELNIAQADPDTRAVVLTGSRKAFAAGADIKEMAERNLVGILDDPRQASWQTITRFNKPLIAAEDARFGQPEINLGIMPGAGGTQRLLRAVGKSMAMQMVLTGEPIDARQAQRAGLVSEVTQPEFTVDRAVQIARSIAGKAPLAVRLAKEALLKAMDTDLASGLRFERHAFTVLAGTRDRDEGIQAFQEKRTPTFTGQ
jgi:enoyl-CoA hydratase